MAEIVQSVKIKTKGDISGISGIVNEKETKSQIVVFSNGKQKNVQRAKKMQ